MSRASVTDIDTSRLQDREALRQRNGVRLVEPSEEGQSVLDLPDGVFGFTYSPAVAAPLFRTFSYRTFEMHRVAGGALIVGFAKAAEAEQLRRAPEELTITIFHDRAGEADTLVVVPYPWIAHHRQYSGNNTPGLELRLRRPAAT